MGKQYTLAITNNLLARHTLAATLVLGASGCQWTALVSSDSNGVLGNGNSAAPALSADGRYLAYQSDASNLVSGDNNANTDIFLRDVRLGITTQVSVDSNGTGGNSGSREPSISADGRYIAFQSDARNLVTNDNNFRTDIFVHDTATGTTSRVSVDSNGVEANNSSREPAISADGRYVAFFSYASNLVTGDTNGSPDVFVHDRQSGTTTRVSVDSNGNQVTGFSQSPAISADGLHVSFQSNSADLVDDDTNNQYDVFVHDRSSGLTRRVSVDSDGNEANDRSLYSDISADGRYITFDSRASNLVDADNNNTWDIFVHDTVTGDTERVNFIQAGNEGNLSSVRPKISDDGRYVSFFSYASNLATEGDSNAREDVFIRDREAGILRRVSRSAGGAQADSASSYNDLSADGRYVAFQSIATNLASGDTNGVSDIFTRAVPEATVSSLVPDQLPIGATTSVTINGSGFLPGTSPWFNQGEMTNIVVIDENTITLDISVPANQTAGPYNIGVNIFGTGAGTATGTSLNCAGCVSLF